MRRELKGKVFAVYKSKGLSSAAVVNVLKKYFQEKKVGYGGTLDPLAKGVLVVGVGREATKQLHQELKSEKEYLAVIKLGEKSTTDDEEGEKTKMMVVRKPTKEEIKSTLKLFEGKIWQTPPVFSAIKIKGREAYKYARAGKPVVLPPKLVEVKEIELLSYRWPYLKIRIVCGGGFYVRSLARDLGEKLGTGAYLKDLERIRAGCFTIKDALPLEVFFSGEKNKSVIK